MSDMVAIDGRALGRRGVQTRARLLEATEKLLDDYGIRDLRVVEIARLVGTSPATFYQYFRDVEDAVLALAEVAGDDVAPLARYLDQPWRAGKGLDDARALVDGFFDYWDRHRPVLRTRNLAAQEGDPRFREIRNRALEPFLTRLSTRIAASQREGLVARELSPVAASAALVALIERMAAFHHDLEPIGVDRPALVETTARIIFQTVVGSG